MRTPRPGRKRQVTLDATLRVLWTRRKRFDLLCIGYCSSEHSLPVILMGYECLRGHYLRHWWVYGTIKAVFTCAFIVMKGFYKDSSALAVTNLAYHYTFHLSIPRVSVLSVLLTAFLMAFTSMSDGERCAFGTPGRKSRSFSRFSPRGGGRRRMQVNIKNASRRSLDVICRCCFSPNS